MKRITQRKAEKLMGLWKGKFGFPMKSFGKTLDMLVFAGISEKGSAEADLDSMAGKRLEYAPGKYIEIRAEPSPYGETAYRLYLH